jgi:hypothetical protein
MHQPYTSPQVGPFEGKHFYLQIGRQQYPKPLDKKERYKIFKLAKILGKWMFDRR